MTTPTSTIRRAELRDLDATLAVLAEGAGNPHAEHPTELFNVQRDTWDRMMRTPDLTVYLAEQGGQAVGNLGHAGWDDLVAWPATASAEESARADEQLLSARAFDPTSASRTTARDMTRLLRLIWSDQAGPPGACGRLRSVMARQLTKHRIASGFRSPVRVAAKSGGLAGLIRNEVGVVTYPDGKRYAVAAFTSAQPGADDRAINAAIGTAASMAVTAPRICQRDLVGLGGSVLAWSVSHSTAPMLH